MGHRENENELRIYAMERTGTVIGALLWIIGFAGFIVGLNVQGEAGKWMEIIGSIAFLAGLGIIGALWMKRKNEER